MTASEKRARGVELAKSREKMNSYTQGSKRKYFFGYPDNKVGNSTQKGYSDCSSLMREIIKALTGIDIGANTSAQINNRKKLGIVVEETDGYYPDESKLLPCDGLYFKGNEDHPLDVGHVEMYIGNGKIIGHGSGTGPKIKNLKDYCKSRANSKKRYFMAIRWIQDDDEDKPDTPSEPDVPDYMTFEIASGTWNVRTGPGTKYESVGKLKGGTKAEGVDTDGWIPIIYKGEVRWIGPSTVKKGV